MKKRIKIEELNVKDLNDKSLVSAHAGAHDLFLNLLRGAKPGTDLRQVVEVHRKIVSEMGIRKMEHRCETELDRLSQPAKGKDGKVHLQDVLPHLKTFMIAKNFGNLVGSLPIDGSGNDVDIMLKKTDLKRIVEFRLSEMLAPEAKRKCHFIWEGGDGPFTTHIPLGSLIFALNPDLDVVKMDDGSANLERAKIEESQLESMAGSVEDYLADMGLVNLEEELQLGEKPLPKNPAADALAKRWTGKSREAIAKMRSGSLPMGFWVLVLHFRGKSAHADFRIKTNGQLEGMTIASQVKGAIKEPVDNLTQAAGLANPMNASIWKFRPDMDPTTHAFAVVKGKHPLDWATVVNHVFEPGSVGATRFEPGVFYGQDWGVLWFGAQKANFKEFFLRGRHFKGRMVCRLLPRRPGAERIPEAAHWECWMTKEEIPYLMTRRGRTKDDYVPPAGVSGLSPEFEMAIPKDLRWWEKKATGQRAMLMMDKAYNQLLEEGYLRGNKIEEG